MTDDQKKSIDEILASIMQGFLIPLVALATWGFMAVAFLFYDKPLDPMLMGSTLGLLGINKALGAFQVTKK